MLDNDYWNNGNVIDFNMRQRDVKCLRDLSVYMYILSIISKATRKWRKRARSLGDIKLIKSFLLAVDSWDSFGNVFVSAYNA